MEAGGRERRNNTGRITENGYVYQWQIDGKRRPFPGLSNAVKAYGERIFFDKPQYAEKGVCPWCGKPVINKRRVYCSDECRREWDNMTVWNRGRDPYSLRILYRDNFTCQRCGAFHAYQNKYGMYIPIDDGKLNVHHVKPVCEGGGDEPENLITLCVDCHKAIHGEIRKESTNEH